MTSEAIEKWTELARNRSSENYDAIKHFHESRNRSGSFGTLRQELDTLIRAIYLLRQDTQERERLVGLTLSGELWKHNGKRRLITDRELVNLANELNGWSDYVYRFGCAFIHLSDLHAPGDETLSARLDENDNNAIKQYVRNYHGFELSDEFRLDEIFQVSLPIFEKIRSNLECYLRHLELGDTGVV